MGAITRTPPANFVPRLAEMTARGFGLKAIADAFDARPDTVSRWLKEEPQAGAVFEAVQRAIPTRHGPEKRPPQDVHEFVRKHAADGDTLVLIAYALGTTDKVLRRWMREDEGLDWAYRVGCAQNEAEWVKFLKRDALDNERPNTNALAYLNRRHGWRRETPEAMSVIVNNFNIPEARPMSDFIEIEHADGA
jgi:hypothetical protein